MGRDERGGRRGERGAGEWGSGYGGGGGYGLGVVGGELCRGKDGGVSEEEEKREEGGRAV